jgi:hypothetical protein
MDPSAFGALLLYYKILLAKELPGAPTDSKAAKFLGAEMHPLFLHSMPNAWQDKLEDTHKATLHKIQDYIQHQSQKDPYKPSSKAKKGDKNGHGNGPGGVFKVAVTVAATIAMEATAITTMVTITLLVLCQAMVATQPHSVVNNSNSNNNKSKLHMIVETLLWKQSMI